MLVDPGSQHAGRQRVGHDGYARDGAAYHAPGDPGTWGRSRSALDFQRVEPALLHELDLAFFEDRFEAALPTEQLLLTARARAGGRSA